MARSHLMRESPPSTKARRPPIPIPKPKRKRKRQRHHSTLDSLRGRPPKGGLCAKPEPKPERKATPTPTPLPTGATAGIHVVSKRVFVLATNSFNGTYKDTSRNHSSVDMELPRGPKGRNSLILPRAPKVLYRLCYKSGRTALAVMFCSGLQVGVELSCLV